MGFWRELFLLGLMCMLWKCCSGCNNGFQNKRKACVDINECEEHESNCGKNSLCFNTNGSFYCVCQDGFIHSGGARNFTGLNGQCIDENECQRKYKICGDTPKCINLIGSYTCTCDSGFIYAYGNCIGEQRLRSQANTHNRITTYCTCVNVNGSYWCRCPEGYTNYGIKKTPCSRLDCNIYNDNEAAKRFKSLENILSMMKNSCLALSNSSATGEGETNGDSLLKNFLTTTETILSSEPLKNSEDVSALLSIVESSIMHIGPQLKDNYTKIETKETEAQIAVQRGKTRPIGPIHLADENAIVDTDWTTASGTGIYSGFALAALLSYKKLEVSVNKSFEELKGHKKNGVDPSFQIYSKVVSVVVSNPSTQNLSRAVNITLKHLQREESPELNYVCVYWNERGAWSTEGCYQRHSNNTHTVCTCKHLSSFAVLMALYPIEHTYGLQIVTKIGLIISLLCLIPCILTFKFCRSIQGTRTTIHLHLCICLFMADLIFLAGISKTEPVGGCRFVAAMLHCFFLGVFTWMLLEGVQLYRMVVLVFNATIRPLYLLLTGYGTPLVVVIISAIIRPDGYGTDKYCWLSLKDGLIWSFFGPVCIIIFINVFFFIITVWKLAQKFTSLNPDLTKLHKIKAFTVTAVAQMCILGLMWVFGAFLFEESSTVVAYIFTILNSLQGALLFVMHCLLSKQVRDEYAKFLSCICRPQKKTYSDLTSTNPSSNSQSQGSHSGQQTGESQI
ncbi:adhesion G protein-coupled receptor E5-like [Channa argus]|uniref:adhesion G protein-coupled receptor E5-like n=1 Tax=Channa argus TaxID=215402 RepID=UPI003520062D